MPAARRVPGAFGPEPKKRLTPRAERLRTRYRNDRLVSQFENGSPAMRAADLDIHELLHFLPEGGIITFAGERVLLLDAVALGLLRKELIQTLGMTAARVVFTRFGYAHGWRVAE